MSITSAGVLFHKMSEGASLVQNPYGRFVLIFRPGIMFDVTYRAASTLLRREQIRYTGNLTVRGARILRGSRILALVKS